jgi:1-acyl-sn-glycerol-3-phosphate acyltransferase
MFFSTFNRYILNLQAKLAVWIITPIIHSKICPMLHLLPKSLKLLAALLLYFCNTLFWLMPILLFSLLKALIPLRAWRTLMSRFLDQMASNWVAINSVNQMLFTQVKLKVMGGEQLNNRDWCLVLSNHQSWVDILVLQRVLHGKVPFLKFFLKQELIYVPLLGLAWWALDFPFMKRYSRQLLERKPHLKGKDLESTKKACAKFQFKPVSVMNFLEGTRFTPTKHQAQQSPFNHLLKPRAGGIAFVMSALGQHLTKIIDVTIHYPQGIPNFIDYISGQVTEVNVVIKVMPLNTELIGDYFNDEQFQHKFQLWVNQLWTEKDRQLAQFNQSTQ